MFPHTCFEFERDVVLIHQVIKFAQSSEERIDPLYGDVQERVPGLVAVVSPHDFTLQIQSESSEMLRMSVFSRQKKKEIALVLHWSTVNVEHNF